MGRSNTFSLVLRELFVCKKDSELNCLLLFSKVEKDRKVFNDISIEKLIENIPFSSKLVIYSTIVLGLYLFRDHLSYNPLNNSILFP
jgi:hypothetical protein